MPIGGPNFNQYVMLEIHYNNPELRSNFIDSSGVRFHITNRLRSMDAGVMELGLEYTDKMAIPPGQESFDLSGYCVTECTAVVRMSRTFLFTRLKLNFFFVEFTNGWYNDIRFAIAHSSNRYQSVNETD